MPPAWSGGGYAPLAESTGVGERSGAFGGAGVSPTEAPFLAPTAGSGGRQWSPGTAETGGRGAAGSVPVGAATLAELERRHIEKTLAQTAGRVEGHFGAARILGLNPNTLRGRMRKLGIDPRRFRPVAPANL
jgi:DNA-binding NtrC family response regulator